MGKKDGMYFYYDWVRPLKRLSFEEVGKIVLAMVDYHQNGTTPPELEGMAGMAADFIFPQIERSKKYAENGSKGGKATVASTVASTDGSSLKHIHKTNTKTNTETHTSPPNPPKGADTITERFNIFWKAYPKKTGKGAAEKAFYKIRPSEELLQKILHAIEIQKQNDQWRRDNGQFIPLPATWLNQKRWEDGPTETHHLLCRGNEPNLDDLF